MNAFEGFPQNEKSAIRFVLTDIDDTLTVNGRLPAAVFNAMEALQACDIRVVPITGRPAGWCDHIARMWPVDGLVGENGAFYFRYDRRAKKMLRRYWKPEAERAADKRRLETIREMVLAAVPGCAVASDQAYRETDLAIDFCEDVAPLPEASVETIRTIFETAGASAKISSIHVNGWFGDYDKLSMTRVLFSEAFNQDLNAVRPQVIFVGDSPNDVPMFGFFPHAVGVANVRDFASRLDPPPAWVTRRKGGLGFAEMVGILLDR
jgi:HAD superfamily hydrolase (TIGR01484 family)